MKTIYSSENIKYNGHELRPHFLLQRFELRGSGLVAFEGPCQVQTDEMVDWEDRLKGDFIEAKQMLHFMGEFFGMPIPEAVTRQRLLISTVADFLNEALSQNGEKKFVIRKGDDLYWDHRKLSVSIVTASPVSQLLHLGINVDPTGAPVPAVGLREMGVAPNTLAQNVLKAFENEWTSIEWACAKVRPVV